MIDTSSGTIVAQTTVQHTDVSIWGMFLGAELPVQIIMVSLLLASFWCWTIIFAKIMELKQLKNKAKRFESEFWAEESLDRLAKRFGGRASDPMSRIFAVAIHEWTQMSTKSRRPSEGSAILISCVNRAVNSSLRNSVEKLQKSIGVLATVGSTAPFIGLFGTVWGIMHSFQSIAASKSTNLAVVAPGIAEALFATALGLVAAIPAVVGFNKLSASINDYALKLETFADELILLLEHNLSEKDHF
jgi:biopolymer transport protein TolQ